MLSVLSLMGAAPLDLQEDLHSGVRGSTLHDPSLHELHDEDEDLHDTDQLGMSKAEIRKSNKPIMEKRRRARINTCLNELKSLILDALKKDPSRHSKLEKADILEMTVKHLQAVQRQQLALAVARNPAVLEKFKGGFTECAQEISRYVSRIDGVQGGVRQRLMHHLSTCTNSLNATTPLSFTAMAGLPVNYGSPPHAPPPPPQPPHGGDLNPNQARLLHRLVAARLAAAGDTAGAALLLQGGLSLLARGGPPPPHPPPPPPPPSSVSSVPSSGTAPPPFPPQGLHPTSAPPKKALQVINEGASSSRREGALRVSAFTVVKRSSSPPPRLADTGTREDQTNPPMKTQKILAPTAIRPLLCSERQPKTLVQAQVALKPVPASMPSSQDEVPCPIDFSFRRNCAAKRRLDDLVPCPRPAKLLKLEEVPPPSSFSVAEPSTSSAGPQDKPPASSGDRREPSPSESPEQRESPENPEGDDKDMWRPW